MAIAEDLEIAIDAARLFASHPAQAPIDGLAFEAGTGRLDFGDDVAAGERVGVGALVEPFDGFEDGNSAARTAVDEPCL